MSRTRRNRSWSLWGLLWVVLGATLATSCGTGTTSAGSETSISVNFDSEDSDSSVGVPPTFETVPMNEAPIGATPSRMLYVSVSGDQALRVLRLGSDGSLTRLEDFDLGLEGQSGPMVLAPQRRRLYVGVDDTVVTVKLGNSGEPLLVARDQLVGVPVYFDLSADESLMVSAYFGEDQISGHILPVDPDSGGQIADQTTDFESGDEPHAAHYNPAHDLVYVPHRSANKISWYTQEGSELALVDELQLGTGIGPRHITFSADGKWAYVINETAVSVSAFQVGPDGGLQLVQTISALPAGRQLEGNSGADIHLTADGKFLYTSIRGDDSIAGYSVGVDGSLSLLARTLTEQRPREFSITPDGRFLVVAGQDSGSIASYEIRPDGVLVLLDTQQVGNAPVWISIN